MTGGRVGRQGLFLRPVRPPHNTLHNQTNERIIRNMSTDLRLVPLALLAAEGHGDNLDQLAQMLADDVVIDVETGLRCVPATVARRLYDEREERRRAQAQALRDAANAPHPVQDRIRALQRRQARLRAEGTWDVTAAGLDNVRGADGFDPHEAASRRLDELREAERQGLAGVGYSYPRYTQGER